MSIKKTCKNCAIDGHCLEQEIRTDKSNYCTNGHFIPKEELVRQDERNKILDLLKEDLEDYRKAREEYKDNKNLSIELAGVFIYINTLISEIERRNNNESN